MKIGNIVKTVIRVGIC